MKNLKSMMCLSLLAVLMAFPQMNDAAPMPQTVNAPQGDDVIINVMGQNFTVLTPFNTNLIPVTVQIATPDGEVVYSAQVSGVSLSIPSSATSRLIRGDGINDVVGDGIDHLFVVGDGIDHLVVGDGIDHLVVGDGIDHLVMNVSQGWQTLLETVL